MDRGFGPFTFVFTLNRDGVPVLKVSDNTLPSSATRPPFLSTLAMGAEQEAKLALGEAKSLICFYESYQGNDHICPRIVFHHLLLFRDPSFSTFTSTFSQQWWY